jgi:uncharacterized protein (DUF2236 family)
LGRSEEPVRTRVVQAVGVHPEAILGPTTLAARLFGHPLLLLAGGRALLMQVTDPCVAIGVAEHSNFREDPYGRLARTLEVTTTIAFGAPEVSRRAAAELRRIHERIRGIAPDGRAFSAADPDLALWVHATLVDTALAVERRYLGLFDERERRACYEETTRLAGPLGIPEELVPPSLDAFDAYVAATVERLADRGLAEASRLVVRALLRPPPLRRLGLLGGIGARAATTLALAIARDLGPARLVRAFELDELSRPPTAHERALVGALRVSGHVVAPLLPAPAVSPSNLARIGALLAA